MTAQPDSGRIYNVLFLCTGNTAVFKCSPETAWSGWLLMESAYLVTAAGL